MKKNILLVFVTALICITGTGYAAYKLTAKEVSFDKSKTDLNGENVQDSIDEIVDLIKYGDAEAGDIASGKTALVNGKKITGISESATDLSSKIVYIGGANGGMTASYNTNITTQISGNKILLLKGRHGNNTDRENWVGCNLAINDVDQTLTWKLLSSSGPTIWYATLDTNIDVGTNLTFKLANNNGTGSYIGCAAFVLNN